MLKGFTQSFTKRFYRLRRLSLRNSVLLCALMWNKVKRKDTAYTKNDASLKYFIAPSLFL